MSKEPAFYLVNSAVLPEVFEKVVKVKKLLQSGEITKINDAVNRVGISRSTYYKYKDYIFPFFETSQGRIITLFFVLDDVPGILSSILNIIAKSQSNILTINQNIPINGIANITISLQTSNMNMDIETLINQLEKIEGVRKIEILARE
mgnify:CR=1 FL=1